MEATERLQQTHRALQEEVARLRAELVSKDRELELRQRLAALGELAAGVAHEVRNPLGAIQLYSGLLRNECRTHQWTPALALIEKIESGIAAIEAVVQDTLALAPREQQFRVCALADVLEHVREATLHTVRAHGATLEVTGDPTGLWVRADERGLERVLINLVVNAAEASPPGGVVRVTASAVAEEVHVRVTDEGAGLPEAIQHRIFDPFFTTKPRGTGLGLTIAHRLSEAYGGRLWAENRPQRGAEFVLALPRSAAPGEQQMDQRRVHVA
jgi:signal transduction histidine kinase